MFFFASFCIYFSLSSPRLSDYEVRVDYRCHSGVPLANPGNNFTSLGNSRTTGLEKDLSAPWKKENRPHTEAQEALASEWSAARWELGDKSSLHNYSRTPITVCSPHRREHGPSTRGECTPTGLIPSHHPQAPAQEAARGEVPTGRRPGRGKQHNVLDPGARTEAAGK